jgi:hypothetical protein
MREPCLPLPFTRVPDSTRSPAVHPDSARDWNRRPLVDRAAPRGRRSPWVSEAP